MLEFLLFDVFALLSDVDFDEELDFVLLETMVSICWLLCTSFPAKPSLKDDCALDGFILKLIACCAWDWLLSIFFDW